MMAKLHSKMDNIKREMDLHTCDQQDIVTDGSRDKAVVEALLYNLWKYGSMHYLALIRCTYVNTNLKLNKYFKPMSLAEKLMFFKNHPKSFIVKNNGYVTMSTAAIERFREEKNKEEKEVVEYLTAVLKEHFGEMLRRKLLRCLRESQLNISNFFSFFSINGIQEFFNEYHSHFVVLDNIYISIRVKEEEKEIQATDFFLQAYQNDSVVTETKFIPVADEHFDDKFPSAQSHLKHSKPFNETTVESLRSTLSEYGPMHYLALIKCANGKPRSQCLKEMSSSEKFAIFKHYSNVFDITDDGYVTPSSSVLKSYKDVPERVSECSLVDYFVSILEADGPMHFKVLANLLRNSDLEAKDYFEPFSYHNLRRFFKRHSQFYVRGDGIISLSRPARRNTTGMNTGFISPVIKFESAQVAGVTDTSAMLSFPSMCSTDKIVPSKRQKVSTSCEKGYSSESGTVFSSQDQDPVSVGVVETKQTELSLSDVHIQSVRYMVIILKDVRSIHCQELVRKACSYDRYTSIFFSHFAPEDVLKFIRIHSIYFSMQDDGIVTLVNPDITPSEVFASKAHVHQVTSILENKAIEFFMDILCQKEQATLSELEQYMGSAPGYIISFFVANYYGADFPKFYQQRSNYFYIHTGVYVQLKLKLSGRQLPNDASACPL